MPMLLETYVGTISVTWLVFVALAVAIVFLCAGGTCVCSDCCALSRAVFHLISFVVICWFHILQRISISLSQALEPLPAANGQVVNHYIQDIVPEYNVDIKKIVSDIVDALSKVSLHYPAPEKPTKYRSPPRKYDVRGWRRKLNERWKRKMKFVRAVLWCFKYQDVSSVESQNEREASAQREVIENNRYSSSRGSHSNSRESCSNLKESCSNSRESHLEEFLRAPDRDEDADLHETILQKGRPHKLAMFKAQPNGKLTPHWE